MNKFILLLLLVALLLAGGILYTLYTRDDVGLLEDQGIQFPSSGGPAVDVVQLSTRDGGMVTVKDFLVDPSTQADEANPGSYFLGQHFSESGPVPPYTITYIAASSYFNIGLFSEPLGAHRKAAEAFLMQRLGISEGQMCALKYTVSTPVRVSEQYSGQSLGFSFCPGSVELPE